MQNYATSPSRNTSVAAGAPMRETPSGMPAHPAPGQAIAQAPNQPQTQCDPSGCKPVQGFTNSGVMQGKV